MRLQAEGSPAGGEQAEPAEEQPSGPDSGHTGASSGQEHSTVLVLSLMWTNTRCFVKLKCRLTLNVGKYLIEMLLKVMPQISYRKESINLHLFIYMNHIIFLNMPKHEVGSCGSQFS